MYTEVRTTYVFLLYTYLLHVSGYLGHYQEFEQKIQEVAQAYITEYIKVKVNECRNRPGVVQRVPGGLDSQIS